MRRGDVIHGLILYLGEKEQELSSRLPVKILEISMTVFMIIEKINNHTVTFIYLHLF